MTKRMRKKAAAEAKTETESVKAAAEAKTETESVKAAAEAKTETEAVKAFRQRLRNERARTREEDKIKRINLHTALSGLPVSGLLDRAVDLILETERLRLECDEWKHSRVVDDAGKRWRSEDAWVEALSTELDSQRARCSDLQAMLDDLGRQRHREASTFEDRIGALITEEKKKFAAMEERYAAALSAETNKKERLELNTVTLLESLQLIGVGSAGPAR